jgi:hypothetical protein
MAIQFPQDVKRSKGGTSFVPIRTVKGRFIEKKNLEILIRYARRFGAGKMLTPIFDVPSGRYCLYEYRQY